MGSLGQAIAYKSAGRLSEAELVCQNILSDEPDNATALLMLGTIYVEQGRVEAAHESLRTAVTAAPTSVEAIKTYVAVCLRLGKPEEAQACLRKATIELPDDVDLKVHLSTISLMQKQPEVALEAAEDAFARSPDLYAVRICLASALLASNRALDAKPHFTQALELHPNSALAVVNLAQISLLQNRFEEALDLTLRAEQLGALDEVGLITRARSLIFLGRANQLQALRARLNPQTESYDRVTVEIIKALISFGDTAGAKAIVDDALALTPDRPALMSQRAMINMYLGNQQAAEAELERVLSKEPDNINVVFALGTLTQHAPDKAITQRLLSLEQQPGLTLVEQSAVAFSLAKVQKDFGDREAELAQLNAGNRARRQSLNYTIDQDIELFEKIRTGYERMRHGGVRRSDEGLSKRLPIFVIGMPRSGTTLVEQILSAHSDVFGAGELPTLSQVVDQHVLRPGAQSNGGETPDPDSMAEQYLSYIRHMGEQERYVIDKSPLNFRYLGFAQMMFPGVRVIRLDRDPRAVCWSIYKQSFEGPGHGYAYDMADVAKFYRMYLDLVAYWDAQSPDQTYVLNYEQLVENPEQETRKLLDYCGLEWQAACLDITANRRAVKTASVQQVREAIYKGSSDAWRAYEPYLQTMLDGLRENGVPLPD